MREAFLTFINMMKAWAREKYNLECLLYVQGGMKDKPVIPSILR